MITVPMVVIRDYLPVLQQLVTAAAPAPGKTAFVRHPKTWQTGTLAMADLVCMVFDDDVPVALVPETARKLAEELIERSHQVESRHGIAH